jgi:hypothetical protein
MPMMILKATSLFDGHLINIYIVELLLLPGPRLIGLIGHSVVGVH